MDQSIGLHGMERARAVESLCQFVAASVDAAQAGEAPFPHLTLRQVFPDDVYNAMMTAMPVVSDYRPMSGRAKGNDAADGTHTRVKIDLFPEYIRHLPADKREVWEIVGRALCSEPVKAAFVRKLSTPLARRFNSRPAKDALYPVPILTRDIPGYRIYPHPDTHWKSITVQLYLPRDDATSHVGTIFHSREPDGSLPKHTQMKFLPNSGYAFAVDEDTWHSADPVGSEVTTRDSILLTYFDDAGVLRFMRNRGKRVGNWVLNELRSRLRR
jgi:hypothetical protein